MKAKPPETEMQERDRDIQAIGAVMMASGTNHLGLEDAEHLAGRLQEFYAVQEDYQDAKTLGLVRQGEVDNRARRMQIASWILDENQNVPVEKIAELLWPAKPPVSDPTQIPTIIPPATLKWPEWKCPLHPDIPPWVHQEGTLFEFGCSVAGCEHEQTHTA